MHTTRPYCHAGFTLIELLVVVGIIGVVVGVTAPAIKMAQDQANSVKCQTNLRAINAAVIAYAADWKGAIPGSPHTTGRIAYANPSKNATANPVYNKDNFPGLVQMFDWASPVARICGYTFEQGPSQDQRALRFDQLRRMSLFQCPSNDILATSYAFSVPQAPAGPMFSYNMPLPFLLVRAPSSTATGVGRIYSRPEWNAPPGYLPRLQSIGNLGRKICVADGARYSAAGVQPDFDLTFNGSMGGAFADQGPAMRYSNSWDRSHAPGNQPHPENPGDTDARIYAYRHGSRTPNGPADRFKFNVAFYDGHVETLGDLQGANPEFWFPQGTELLVNDEQIHADVITRFFNGAAPATGKYIVP